MQPSPLLLSMQQAVVNAVARACPGCDLELAQDMWSLAMAIAEKEWPQSDEKVLLMASYCLCPVRYSNNLRCGESLDWKRLSADLGLTGEQIELLESVLEYAQADCKKIGQAGSPEAKVMHDARLVQHCGADTVFHLISEGMGQGQKAFCRADPTGQGRGLNRERYAIDRIMRELLAMPARIITPTGKSMGLKRMNFLHQLLDGLRDHTKIA